MDDTNDAYLKRLQELVENSDKEYEAELLRLAKESQGLTITPESMTGHIDPDVSLPSQASDVPIN